ncbi:MAG: hypothetical protein B6230_07850 [Desulfobacteraceae bacterium 4572_89]|nr:MAG: hypothetical protein B6230_07850 [Desulfobacteraceae bacterium 4572_89]
MKNFKKDNSTQKLLDLIRTGEEKKVIELLSDDSDTSLPVSIKSRHLNVGVFITQRDISLVMTSNLGFTKKKGLVKWKTIPLPEILRPENLLPENNEFPVFLKKCLDMFLEDKKKVPIWCALESSSLKIKNIIIPDIPQAKIANAAFWGLKKEMEFNEDQEIFNFEILGDILIDGIKKKNLLVFSAPKTEVLSLKNTFQEAGYNLAGITSIPFAMQNFIRTGQTQVDDPYFAIVNISRENSEIYCFFKKGILLVRSLRTGTQQLMDELDCPLDMDPIGYLSSMTTIDSSEFSPIKEVSERMISKIIRTGDYCAQHYTGNNPIQRYIFYGETDHCTPFMLQASNLIPAAVETFEPVKDSLSATTEAGLPKDVQQKNTVLTCFGIALSSNDITPNFLFTFDDQLKAKKQRKITLATALAGTIMLAMVVSAHFMLNFTLQKDLSVLAGLKQEQMKFGNEIQMESITRAISIGEKKNSARKQYIDNYLALAIIYDVCHFTPNNIHLSSMTYDQRKNDQRKNNQEKNDRKKDKAGPEKQTKKLFVEGQVTGLFHLLNSELGNYILKLSDSPVFGDIEITDKQIQQKTQDKTLFFKATLEVL